VREEVQTDSRSPLLRSPVIMIDADVIFLVLDEPPHVSNDVCCLPTAWNQ
jgi:hypothetical protein